MDKWPPFEEYSRASDELAIITREQYNQARDAITWQEMARSVYPNTDRLIALADKIKNASLKPQPTGDK